jgi:hypothetical protein
MPTDKRPEFLAVYDHDTGGVWVKVRARSPEEIASRFPQLTVFPVGERPGLHREDALRPRRA